MYAYIICTHIYVYSLKPTEDPGLEPVRANPTLWRGEVAGGALLRLLEAQTLNGGSV